MSTNLKVELSEQNSSKVRSLMTEMNMSGSQIVNLILDKVGGLEMRQVVTFIVEVHDGANAITRRKPFRRVNVFEKRF